MAITSIAVLQLAFAGLAAAPFLLHRYRMSKWLEKCSQPTCPAIEGNELPQMTLVLPIWNESLVIKAKLDDLAGQEYPREKLELIIIDSASTDESVDLVEAWLATNPNSFPRHNLIRMEARLGKTTAIERAFKAADSKSTVLAMTDAEAMLNAGSLLRLGAWFFDEKIGAVGATPHRYPTGEGRHQALEESYRDYFTMQRLAESAVDSTPFLEGSLLGFRQSIHGAGTFDVGSNADDAQLAVAARIHGFSAIQDPHLVFKEPMPPTAKEHRRQKVRRAQGLQRLLWRYRKKWFADDLGTYGNILGWQGLMHIGVPWLVLAGSAMAVTKWMMLLIGGDVTIFLATTLVLDALVFGGWLARRCGFKLRGTGMVATFLDSMTSLLRAQLLLLFGKSLHIWEQGAGVRNTLAQTDLASGR